MIASKNFILRDIAGEHILVPVGSAAARLNGIVTLNDSGCFVWKRLVSGATAEELVGAVMGEYDVDRETAAADIAAFAAAMRAAGAIED